MNFEEIVEVFLKNQSINIENIIIRKEYIKGYKKILEKSVGKHEFHKYCKELEHEVQVKYDIIEKTKQQQYERLLDKLFLFNPSINIDREKFRIRAFTHFKENSKTINIQDKSLILLDPNTIGLLHKMGKIFIFGEHLSQKEKIVLTSKVFLNFVGANNAEENQFMYKCPKLPIHKNQDDIFILGIFEDIQTTFLIAHEVAHYLINTRKEYKYEIEQLNIAYNEKLQSIQNKDELLTEVLADTIAFYLTFNVYDHKENVKDLVNLFSPALFLLIRYNVCARSVCFKSPDDYEYVLWIIRDDMFRKNIRNLFRMDIDPPVIIDLWENFVEPVLEKGSLYARVCYEEDKKDKTPRIINLDAK